ncbi:hypothetical protein [Pectinatus haikarae]|uniref:hypothetical protein n=1 Tax=Pectinatus haikarae TaxID=349096 RepID=UPI0018C7626F|nr:hypothetical protein [Pectinatus haikarae]
MEYWSEVTSDNARDRNLLITVSKVIKAYDLDRGYSRNEIQEIFYFRKKDFKYHINKFFIPDKEGNYYIADNIKGKIIDILKEHNTAISKVNSAKEAFIRTFGRFQQEYKNPNRNNFDFSNFELLYKKIAHIIPILHWGLLPIIKEEFMIDRGRIPEDGVIQFYDDYDMLDILLREVTGEGEKMTLKGDCNLDKPLNFSVYSRRWGHYDNYRIKRTVDGWDVGHIAINGSCKKNGENVLFANLNHDSIFYPEDGIKHALEVLWNEADETEMSIEELQNRLQQVADWISIIEKTLGENQPNWVNYY